MANPKIIYNLEKIIHQQITKLPLNKRLVSSDLIRDVVLFYINTLNDKSDTWKNDLNFVLDQLVKNNFVIIVDEPRSPFFTIGRGLDFDDWSNKIRSSITSGAININVTANSVQIGDNNKQALK